MENKTHMFEFNSGEIVSVSIYKSPEHYNYASVNLKRGKSYININYEWQGDETPDFVMDMVAFFGPNMATASVEDNTELQAFIKRLTESLKCQ